MARTPTPQSFVSHARLIGVITLLSRVLGLGREMVAAAYFGAGPVWTRRMNLGFVRRRATMGR